ncbi:MAG: DsrE family protein [Acetobacteraceae bacterium]
MPAEPLGILLLAEDQARAHYGFVLAAGAAALGQRVVIFAAGRGVHALAADPSALADFARDGRIRARGVAGLAEVRAAACEIGVRLIACSAALQAEAMAPADLLAGVEIGGVVGFLESVGRGQIVCL